MYEITTGDASRFEGEKAARHVYRNGVYVFTFEHAFFIYYYHRAAGGDSHVYEYIAVSAATGCGSHICCRDKRIPASSYDVLIPDILKAISYTGDRRMSV